jgi:hypothetical protein
MLLDIIKSIDLFASLTSLTFLKNLFFFNFIFQYWIDLELSFIIYSIFLFIKSSLSQKISRYWIGAWSYDCLFLLSYSWIIFLKKKQVINPSGVHDSIHRYNMLTQVTRFTSLTSLPIELDIYFSFWSFIFLFHHLILDLLRNIFHNLFFFRFYKVITI